MATLPLAPQIKSRNYPRDLLNSVFWQRRYFYSQPVKTLGGMCVRVRVYTHKKRPNGVLLPERLTYNGELAYSPAVNTQHHDGGSPLAEFQVILSWLLL